MTPLQAPLISAAKLLPLRDLLVSYKFPSSTVSTGHMSGPRHPSHHRYFGCTSCSSAHQHSSTLQPLCHSCRRTSLLPDTHNSDLIFHYTGQQHFPLTPPMGCPHTPQLALHLSLLRLSPHYRCASVQRLHPAACCTIFC